jgi:hypothetical protein
MHVVAEVVPGAMLRVVPGANHNAPASAIAPWLVQHFTP